jgi:hypothetical protein
MLLKQVRFLCDHVSHLVTPCHTVIRLRIFALLTSTSDPSGHNPVCGYKKIYMVTCLSPIYYFRYQPMTSSWVAAFLGTASLSGRLIQTPTFLIKYEM